MLYEKPNDLTSAEKEILLLKAVMETINSMVNYSVFKLNHNDPDSSIRFETGIHQQYFNILLVDFLSLEIFEPRKPNLFKELLSVCENPRYNDDAKPLKKAVMSFQEWLGRAVEFEHNGEVRKLWFPSIDQEIALQITREEFIKICGNISKHNPLGLNRQASAIKKIFERNDADIALTDALLIMDEFYEQFHDDLFTYHSSTIAEFLNNLRWAIYEYLQPLYEKVTENYWHEKHEMWAYRYHAPEDITNAYIKTVFWNLMNDVRREPYMPRFQVTRYLKMHY
ncbi:MAG: hypothetical protein KDI13_03860 [Alphaproteobacteria bacterium]|nr:hypothetical protein [Alphaproteobacteria bacterium]